MKSLTDGQVGSADRRCRESRNGRQTVYSSIVLGGDFKSAVGVHEAPIRAHVIGHVIHRYAVHSPGKLCCR